MSAQYFSLLLAGYLLAAGAYLIVTILFLTRYRGRLRSGVAALAGTVSFVALVIVLKSEQGVRTDGLPLFLLEIVPASAWLLYLSSLARGSTPGGRGVLINFGGAASVMLVLGGGLLVEYLHRLGYAPYGAIGYLGYASLLIALLALVLIEQLYRNARESQRRALKYVCIGLGCKFTFDIFMYSTAMLAGEVDALMWAGREVVVAMSVPLLAIAAHRSSTASVGVYVSRQVVFYSATLFGAGIYLLLVGASGYYLRIVGGDWGGAALFIFASAAIVALFVILFSDHLRLRLRVFINKHFFEARFDYRQEWLRLIATLTADEEGLPLRKRAIKALAQIVGSGSGQLWTWSETHSEFECQAGWNVAGEGARLEDCKELLAFLQDKQWVIEFDELEADRDRYAGLRLNKAAFGLEDPGYLIPLIHDQRVLGFVVLAFVPGRVALNYEDRDLFKTSARQIAIHLVQEAATEKLSEARQFEAFNKLTAFIMHDMKNLIAQQSLVVENAKKHKDDPEFVDDMIGTITGSVARMRRVLDYLQQNSADHHTERVELGRVVMQAASQCADRKPLPQAKVHDGEAWVEADKERLLMAITHAIRNAQDATSADGEVVIRLLPDSEAPVLTITDTGSGMDIDFIKNRLFRPFDSTKGTQGMGIGAYQIRETVAASGGEVSVESVPGEGTTLRLQFRASA